MIDEVLSVQHLYGFAQIILIKRTLLQDVHHEHRPVKYYDALDVLGVYYCRCLIRSLIQVFLIVVNVEEGLESVD